MKKNKDRRTLKGYVVKDDYKVIDKRNIIKKVGPLNLFFNMLYIIATVFITVFGAAMMSNFTDISILFVLSTIINMFGGYLTIKYFLK